MIEWMMVGIGFWFYLGRAILEVGFALLFFLIVLTIIYAPMVIRRIRCKHLTYFENMACNAICNRCGKNLGFIGKIRDERNK